MARVLALSSHVARGHVGLTASVPALQWLGHEVWTLPTVLLASRPGLGSLVKRDVAPEDLDAMLAALEADGCWPDVDGVLTGYFSLPASVSVAARAIARIRAANPKAIVLLDPVIGDSGRLYVAPEVAAAIRDELLPLATLATPNRFELEWLTGRPAPTAQVRAEAARRLGPAGIAITSAETTDTTITTEFVTPDGETTVTTPRYAGVPNGAGDLFAGLLLGHALQERDNPSAALRKSLATLDHVLAASSGRPVLDLTALAGSTP